MKRSTIQRIALSGLVALSVAGGSLAPAVAGHAAAGGRGGLCPKPDYCPWPGAVTQHEGVPDGGASGGVLGDSSKPGTGDFRDSIKPGGGDFRDGRIAPLSSPDGDASKPTGSGDASRPTGTGDF